MAVSIESPEPPWARTWKGRPTASVETKQKVVVIPMASAPVKPVRVNWLPAGSRSSTKIPSVHVS